MGAAGTASAKPRVHDGFYMQVTGGVGYYTMSSDVVDASGLTFPNVGLMLGGSIKPGLAIGGGFFVDYAPSPSFDPEIGVDTSQFLIGLGGFADYYLKPEGGLHFQGFFGWGGLDEGEDRGGFDPTGLVIGAGGGYDVFISDEWSAGVLGRIAYAPLSYMDVSFTTISPAILGTLTWH